MIHGHESKKCKVEFLKYTPFSDNVVSFSVKLNEALKAISDVSFMFDKTMLSYFRESFKTNNETNEKLSLPVF